MKFHIVLSLANYYSNQGKYREAEEKFNGALSIDEVPNSSKAIAHYNLGSMYERRKDYEKQKMNLKLCYLLFRMVAWQAGLISILGWFTKKPLKQKRRFLT